MDENENKNFDPKEYDHFRHLRDKLICLYYYKKTDELKCEMCGEKDIAKLTINHIDKDRDEDEYSGSAWYSEQIRKKLPDKEKYNVLCNSCQLTYQYNRKIYIKNNEKFKNMMEEYINKIKNTDEDLDHVMDLKDVVDEKVIDDVKGGINGN